MTKEDPEETKDLGMVLMEDVKPYYTAEKKAKLLEEFEVSFSSLVLFLVLAKNILLYKYPTSKC